MDGVINGKDRNRRTTKGTHEGERFTDRGAG